MQSANAISSTNTYWINLKSKLSKYLKKNINPSLYTYKIIGPARDMKNFLGNRADAQVKFSNLNLTANSHRKNMIATAYGADGKRIDSLNIIIDVFTYHQVYMLKNSVPRGGEITSSNIYQTRIPIKRMNSRLYYDGILKQKVATRDIPAGIAIMKNMLRHEKVIQVGDTIQVTSGSHSISLEFMCKAISSGDIGEMITLNCPDMQKRTMKAEVLSSGRAKLI